MKICVQLETENGKEENLKYEFMNKLVKELKKILYTHIDEVSSIKIEKAIINSKTILWKTKTKPKSIDTRKVLIEIIKNIRWYERKENNFEIRIDSTIMFPKTNTTLVGVAKIIEYGSPYSLPLHYFSRYFNEFTNKARVYWSAYKESKTQIKVKELVIVR